MTCGALIRPLNNPPLMCFEMPNKHWAPKSNQFRSSYTARSDDSQRLIVKIIIILYNPIMRIAHLIKRVGFYGPARINRILKLAHTHKAIPLLACRNYFYIFISLVIVLYCIWRILCLPCGGHLVYILPNFTVRNHSTFLSFYFDCVCVCFFVWCPFKKTTNRLSTQYRVYV